MKSRHVLADSPYQLLRGRPSRCRHEVGRHGELAHYGHDNSPTLFGRGTPRIRSKLSSSDRKFGIGSGCNSTAVFRCDALPAARWSARLQGSFDSWSTFGHQNKLRAPNLVLSIPGRPASRWSWNPSRISLGASFRGKQTIHAALVLTHTKSPSAWYSLCVNKIAS